MSKPWGGVGVGAWALEAEQAEAEEREHAATATAAATSFPSLKESAAAKPKKKKGTTLSLSEFTSGTPVGPNSGGGAYRRDPPSKFLTHEEMLRLPTGPKERSAEELENTRGFRSYGYGTGGGSGGGGGAGGGGRRSPYGGGFDEENRRGTPPSRASDLDMPSRADEVDNWGAGKKAASFSPMDSGMGRQDRYGSLGSGSSSKADEADNWFSAKKPISTPAPSRYSGFGSGFRDSSGSSDSDRWVRGGGGGMMSNNGDRDLRERPKLVLDPRKGEVGGSGTPTETGKTRPSPFGAARPREEVLAEKGLDWRKIDTEIEVKKTSRPTSSHSSRPNSSHSSRPGSPGGSWAASVEGGEKARPKVNPFGDARPREVLLEEKGKDWKKIDLELEHRRVDRPETEEEKLLKEEIDHLTKALSSETESSDQNETSLRDQISQRENDLEKLTRELDDKVRFGQKVSGSGGNRFAFSSDRPPSQSGMFDESKSMEFLDRPRSRGGAGDNWSKTDDRRGFQGGKETGFLSSRNTDRSKREGW